MGLARLLPSPKERKKNELEVKKANKKLKAKMGKDLGPDALSRPALDVKLSMESRISSPVHRQAVILAWLMWGCVLHMSCVAGGQHPPRPGCCARAACAVSACGPALLEHRADDGEPGLLGVLRGADGSALVVASY